VERLKNPILEWRFFLVIVSCLYSSLIPGFAPGGHKSAVGGDLNMHGHGSVPLHATPRQISQALQQKGKEGICRNPVLLESLRREIRPDPPP
jgi:hypothetical protein